MARKSREQQIATWLDRIERSSLSPQQFLARHSLPFSLVQYYRYRAAYEREGLKGLVDGRSFGNNRRIHPEAEGFLLGYLSAHPEASRPDLLRALEERFGIQITSWGLGRCLRRLGVELRRSRAGVEAVGQWSPCAGLQLVVALAWHFGWPQSTAELIQKAIARARRSEGFAAAGKGGDLKGRNRRGQFTARYNKRSDVRRNRFESVELKRSSKLLESMDLVKVGRDILARKCLAVLALPFVTHNGQMRTVDTATGKALKAICGFQYKQASLARFLAELKYLGLSEELLRHQVGFWRACWRNAGVVEEHLPLLCYYIDGNTKALWSTKRVKKHKVTMLGRVMGCLEQVFVHDSHGRPIYFETYSGHAPMGEYVLSLFQKIEASLDGPGSELPVRRAIVMDGASNSVRTLRAFASQDRYHYITSLDENQWSPRKLRKQGRPQRYRHGAATLRDCEIELEDSREKGYLFLTRAIQIEWDRGKETYLATSLPKEVIGASRVVKAYFDRWPDEELPFKIMKAVASLNRVAGYGKQKLPDRRVQKRQSELARQIAKIKTKLSDAQRAVEKEETRVAALIPKERRLRATSRIVDGRRILPPGQAEELRAISRGLARHERRIRAIRKTNPEFKKLERAEREWLRLQGKDKVYKVDVELDQIMTYFRVSLVNLYTHLSRLLGGSHLSLVKLLHAVLLLPGRIEESAKWRHVVLESNDKDPRTMQRLRLAIDEINELRICDANGRRFTFAIG